MPPVPESDRLLIWMLRQAVILCRNRAEPEIEEMAVEMTSKGYRLRLPRGWRESNPLTRLALEDEAAYWSAVGVSCQYE